MTSLPEVRVARLAECHLEQKAGYCQHASLNLNTPSLQNEILTQFIMHLQKQAYAEPTVRTKYKILRTMMKNNVDLGDPEFIDSLDPLLEDIGKNVDDLRGKWLSVLEKIVSAYETDELKKFLPQDAVHEECGYSHEGLEFLYAISLELLGRILNGKDFEDLARRHKFKK